MASSYQYVLTETLYVQSVLSKENEKNQQQSKNKGNFVKRKLVENKPNGEVSEKKQRRETANEMRLKGSLLKTNQVKEIPLALTMMKKSVLDFIAMTCSVDQNRKNTRCQLCKK
ncbi:hypothetical protein Trydic_g10926 [Trypoxylus dichotomus]